MNKTIVNFWLDSLLLVVFALQLWVATVLQFIFPPGPNAAGWSLWGWSYFQWGSFQFTLLCLFGLGALLHVMLHWTWVCGVATNKLLFRKRPNKPQLDDGHRTIIGVGVLILLLHVVGVGVAAAALMIRSPAL